MRVPFLRLRPALHWPALVLASAAGSSLFTGIGVPAGALLGCMVAAVLLASLDMDVQMPPYLFALGQALIACLMAHSLHFEVLQRVAADWMLFLGMGATLVCASVILGYWLMRTGLLPGTTAVWGLAPGAASVMVLLAEDFGADTRLVAFMQYLRLAIVVALASLVAHSATGWGQTHTATQAALSASSLNASILQDWATHFSHWVEVHNPLHAGLTGALSLACAWLGRRWGVPGGTLLVPMLAAMAFDNLSPWRLELPGPVLLVAYAVLGWGIGLRFNRAILAHAWRLLPRVLAAIGALIVLGLLMAAGLIASGRVAPLTAYLATSPGGADSVAVIAAASAVDAGFVMAMQMVRFFMVLLFGPRLARWLVVRVSTRSTA